MSVVACLLCVVSCVCCCMFAVLCLLLLVCCGVSVAVVCLLVLHSLLTRNFYLHSCFRCHVAAILDKCKEDLEELEHSELHVYLQGLPPMDMNEVCGCVYVWVRLT